MSMQAISSSAFSLTPLHQETYQLDVHFLGEDKDILAKKSSVFVQQSPVEAGVTWDIFSQNGVCSDGFFTSKDRALFHHQDENGIKAAVKKLDGKKLTDPSVVVLDLKDPNRTYLDGEAIGIGEETVCQFLSNDGVGEGVLPRAKKVHQVLKGSLPLDYVLCEGSLKFALLTNFSENEADFFLNRNPVAFCQYAEFYMNAFKLGQCTKTLSPEALFKPISHSKPFKPQKTSTVLYPAAYQDIYSVDGPFFQTMKPVFSIKGTVDGRITSVSVEKL